MIQDLKEERGEAAMGDIMERVMPMFAKATEDIHREVRRARIDSSILKSTNCIGNLAIWMSRRSKGSWRG